MRTERGARFSITRRPSTSGWTWRRHSNGRVLAHGHVADLRRALQQIETVTGGRIVNEVRGPRKRLERAIVEQCEPSGRMMLTRLEVLW